MGDHVWRFELAPASAKGHDTGLHPHFVCNTCGDVTCLPDDAIEIQVGHGGPRSLQGREVEIQIKGRCDSCA
jgi:Fur family ferric uptake transcriptional regulator